MATPPRDARNVEVDLQGCILNHCHRSRSPRQEGYANEDGIPYGCHQAAGWGTEHPGFGACRQHGGNTPTAIVRASRERAESILNGYATPANVDPAEALLEDVQRSAGIVRYLTKLVATMDPDDYTYGLSEQTTEPAIINADSETLTFKVTEKRRSGIHPLITLLQQSQRHLREVARDAVAAGVSMRMVNIYEQAADPIVDAFERVFDSLNLTPEQRALIPAAVVREMRVIRGEVEPT